MVAEPSIAYTDAERMKNCDNWSQGTPSTSTRRIESNGSKAHSDASRTSEIYAAERRSVYRSNRHQGTNDSIPSDDRSFIFALGEECADPDDQLIADVSLLLLASPRAHSGSCTICSASLGDGTGVIELPCGHLFHWRCCAKSFRQSQGSCPACFQTDAEDLEAVPDEHTPEAAPSPTFWASRQGTRPTRTALRLCTPSSVQATGGRGAVNTSGMLEVKCQGPWVCKF
mmetsp:Transcript_76761/g.222858  ORF Transcript_76761/g.222858 Transcript_76761/m.222858 type:complete len:228 (+) Transcript_76761:117-800(+)